MKTLLICVTVIIVVLLLLASNTDKPSMESAVDNTLAAPTTAISKEDIYRNNFMTACMKEGAAEYLCECYYTGVVERYTYDQRKALEELIETEIPDGVMEVYEECTGDSFVQ